jgi:meiotically up-regulated gene 157 (Mug157) protein
MVRALTSNDDQEIMQCLEILKNSTAGTGFMHESVTFFLI